MKALIIFIVVVGIGLALLIARSARGQPRQNHDPVEYYRGWRGYRHPITLENKITKEEAEAIASKGSAYLIGHFDAEGKLRRVVKMLRGSVFFDFVYEYHPYGKHKSATVTNANGKVTARHYDERGRGLPGNREREDEDGTYVECIGTHGDYSTLHRYRGHVGRWIGVPIEINFEREARADIFRIVPYPNRRILFGLRRSLRK